MTSGLGPGLGTFLLRTLARAAAVVALVCTLAFTLVEVAPLDPLAAYLGYDRMQISTEQQERIIERFGLNEPAPVRFAHWAGNVLTGDMGYSFTFNAPVAQVIAERARASLALMAIAWVLSGVMGFALGCMAGAWPDSLADRLIRLYSFTLAGTPAFWLAMVLLVVFAVTLGWLPYCCGAPPGVPPEDVTLWMRVRHLILPALTLSLTGVAQIAMHTREKMADAMASEYADYARAQGHPEWRVALSHGVPNVLLPAIVLQFASLGELFGGSVLAEQVFAYPGLGSATVQAGTSGDVPLLLGITLVATLFVVAGNVIADVLCRVADPRVRFGAAATVPLSPTTRGCDL